jgi:hypothetical protein
MLFGWIPLTIFFFFKFKSHHAVLFSVIGGWLLLPTAGFDLPGLPEYTKSTSIAIGLISGGWLSGARQQVRYNFSIYDIPMFLWCISPFISSMTNKLGLYDGLSTAFQQVVVWGIPYIAARIYFDTSDKLYDLCIGIIIGGLVYLPLCLYEIRMSPELNKTLYGFFPHSWLQHKRYGGWRPIVFMHHGLMVALWMATSSIALFWLWREKKILQIKGLPASFIVVALFITTVLCKSANGWVALAIGSGFYFVYRKFETNLPFRLLLLSVPIYAGFRISGIISGEDIQTLATSIFDAERVSSLSIRILQEDLFIKKAMESPLFGWGGYNRGWPVDPITGEVQIKWVDSLWLITFSKNGFFGLVSMLAALLTGPWLIFRSNRKNMQQHGIPTLISTILGLVIVLFMIDCLVNGMINPIYTMISGSLVGCYLIYKKVR